MGTIRLAVPLTDADRLMILGEMSAAQSALEAAEAEKKRVSGELSEEIKGHKATVHDRNEKLRSGQIWRDVAVEIRPNPENGKHETWRLDTNTIVRAADMDPEERQVRLGLEGPKVLDGGKKDDAGKTDEQLEADTPEEAERLRAERLANERAERISATCAEERTRITVMRNKADGPLEGTLNFGDHVLTGIGPDDEQCRDAIIRQLVPILEEQEDAAAKKVVDDAAAEAEKARADREARIETAIAAERPRIRAVSQPNETDPKRAFLATLQYGNVVLQAEAETEEAAADGVATQVRDCLEADEEKAAQWAGAVAASEIEQNRQADEVAQLAAEQAEDDKATKKRTLGGGLKNGGLKVPKGHKKKTTGRRKHDDAAEGEPDTEAAPTPETEAAAVEVTIEHEGETLAVQAPLCPPECDETHEHTAERGAF